MINGYLSEYPVHVIYALYFICEDIDLSHIVQVFTVSVLVFPTLKTFDIIWVNVEMPKIDKALVWDGVLLVQSDLVTCSPKNMSPSISPVS